MIDYILGDEKTIARAPTLTPLPAFSAEVTGFLSALADRILKSRSRFTADVATVAFFCRRANLEKLRQRYPADEIRLGRGMAFHITPSNVPVNFAFSLIAGLLAGNSNVVRLPSVEFDQVRSIVEVIASLLELDEHRSVRERIALLRYPREDSQTTDWLSSLCDTRVLWGGDQSIRAIRNSPLSPRAFDVTFGDRFSVAAIRSKAVLEDTDITSLARKFFNDTYLFDQNACSSPHLVVWVGSQEETSRAQPRFWEAVEATLKGTEVAAVTSVDKLSTLLCHAAAKEPGTVRLLRTNSNRLWRVDLSELGADVEDHRCAAGYFMEHVCADLSAVTNAATRSWQTLTYFGYRPEEIREWIAAHPTAGIDRVVPVGSAGDFGLVWDGYDLIRSLSREVSVA